MGRPRGRLTCYLAARVASVLAKFENREGSANLGGLRVSHHWSWDLKTSMNEAISRWRPARNSSLGDS